MNHTTSIAVPIPIYPHISTPKNWYPLLLRPNIIIEKERKKGKKKTKKQKTKKTNQVVTDWQPDIVSYRVAFLHSRKATTGSSTSNLPRFWFTSESGCEKHKPFTFKQRPNIYLETMMHSINDKNNNNDEIIKKKNKDTLENNRW